MFFLRLCCPVARKVLHCFSCSASFSSKNLVKLEKTFKPFFFFFVNKCAFLARCFFFPGPYGAVPLSCPAETE